MHKILFVCHGNICRSPMAQFVMQDLVKQYGQADKFLIDSAAATRDEISANGGHPMDPRTIRTLVQYQVPFTEHYARQLTKADYDKFDLLIGMDEENALGMNQITGGDPELKEKKLLSFTGSAADIEDPWFTGDFDLTYRQIEKGCQALYKYLTENE